MVHLKTLILIQYFLKILMIDISYSGNNSCCCRGGDGSDGSGYGIVVVVVVIVVMIVANDNGYLFLLMTTLGLNKNYFEIDSSQHCSLMY